MNKPRPCPVCGKQPKVRNSVSKWGWIVLCMSKSRYRGYRGTFHEVEAVANTKDAAINNWNEMVP